VPDASILVVEDDAIIGLHIQAILQKNGFDICAVVTSGKDAIQYALETRPELILMDIQLEGPLDGINTAETIHASYSVPIIYLTAFADNQTLQRAKITDPFGYVLKPFEERGLITNIEMALNKHRLETAEREQRALAEALRDTAAALTSSLALDVVLDRILSNVGRVVPHHEANIMLIEGDQLRIVRASSEPDATRNATPGPVSQWQRFGFMQSIIAGRGPVVVGDVYGSGLDQIFPPEGGIKSAVVAPIRIKGSTVGIVNLGSAIANDFSKAAVDRLQVFADQAGIAIENARLFEESQNRARYLAILNQVTQAAINSSDLNATLTEIARILADLYKSDGVYINIWDEPGQLTIPAAAFGFIPDNFGADMHSPGELTLTASTLKLGKPIIVDDVKSSEYIAPNLAAPMPLRSLLGIPLIAGDQKLGGIIVGFKEHHKFLPEDVAQGQEIAGQVALAITKLRLYAEIQRLAIVDELTGLYNRRGIFELGRKQVEQAHQIGASLSIVWLDIDQFKQINDRFGHHIGDEVITVLADRCRNNLKKRDLIGRYGGEGGDELIIVLPETNLDAAMEIAERLRVVIMKSPISTHEGTITVTVSQGVTALRGDTEDFSDLLNRADKAMYAAKAAGRNCVLMQA
jgi:diguanylate cyclase (GGDEF)-like protein